MSDLPTGARLGGYRVGAVLGRGATAVVYLAQQLALERRVALKVIEPELSADAGFRERFMRDARLAAGIDHPNVIPVYDAGEADGRMYLSMRYVKGLDLRTTLRLEGPMAPRVALGVLDPVAGALDAAHAAGLVHGDVKPSNILIEDGAAPPDDRVFLTDFAMTQHEDGGHPIDVRMDVASLASVLHECLTPDLLPALDAVMARALDPAGGYATCEALVQAARDAIEGGASAGGRGATVIAPPPRADAPVSAGGFRAAALEAEAPTAPVPAVPAGDAVAPDTRRPAPGPVRASRRLPGGGPGPRRGWVVAALAAGVLVGGGVALAVGLSGSEPRAGSPGTRAGSSTPAPGVSGQGLAGYVGRVEDLLRRSEATRQRLTVAVGEARTASPERRLADLRAVREVVAQRKSALDVVVSWDPPRAASAANDLLATAFRDALADDLNYERLIQAYIDGDASEARGVLDELDAHRRTATDPDKRAFLRSYDALRRTVGLEPLPAGARF